MKRRAECVHCHNVRVIYGRGLCHACHQDRSVRASYELWHYDDPKGPMPPPAEPTTAAPGTEEKVKVLTERMARMEDLWHPRDAGWMGEGEPLPGRRGVTSEETIQAIHRLARQGMPDRAIARTLGISWGSVYDIRTGRRRRKGATA